MGFINLPNIPNGKVKLFLVDDRFVDKFNDKFKDEKVEVLAIKPNKNLYNAISSHPDIMLHHLGDKKIVHSPCTDKELLLKLAEKGFDLICGEKSLSSSYPSDIAYNVARVSDKAFHDFDKTDPVLKKQLEKLDIKMINVKQGYSKCSISIVDENSIITQDKGIAKAAEKNGVDVLYIQPDKSISLYELNYGFIGGCSGLIDKDTWAITGDLNLMSESNKIIDFIKSKGKKAVSLHNGPIIDVGSIIPLIEEDK